MKVFHSSHRWPVTATVTLAAQLWVTVAPSVAYAQDDLEAEPSSMVPLSDYTRVDGGSLSTAGDRASASAEDGDDSPRASGGQQLTNGDSEPDGGQKPGDDDTDREGGNDGTDPGNGGGELPGETPNTDTLGLPGGQDKTGVSAQTISVPKGSGSIKGMEESFSAQLSTGIATFSVPFALMPGRGGASPSLGLSYSSAGGLGPAGQGWSVGVPFIARQTDRGLPQYLDGCNRETAPGYSCAHPNSWHPNQDRFVYNGGQELVPVCTVVGGACEGALTIAGGAAVDEVMPGWAEGYQYFRPRVEGSFLRFFWAPDHESWIVQDKSGTIMEIGQVNGNGPALGGLHLAGDRALERNPERPSEIYKWHLARQYDQHVSGDTPLNLVVYDYIQRGAMAYVSDIYDTAPFANATSVSKDDFAHHTALRWEERTDPTDSYRPGWLMSSELRLAGVDVASKTFHGGAGAPRKQVRRYHLSYRDDLHRTLLSSVQVEGRCGGSEDDASTPSEAGGRLPEETGCGRLPAMTFEHSEVDGYDTNGDATNESLTGYMPFDGRAHTLSSPNHSIDEELTDFFDINSDGLPDVLVTAPGLYSNGHAAFFNGKHGTLGYSGFTPMGIKAVLGANSGSITLKNLNISPQDVDGDGHVNLLHMPRFKKSTRFTIHARTRITTGGGSGARLERRMTRT